MLTTLVARTTAEARRARHSFGAYCLVAASAGLVGARVLDVVAALA